MLNILKSSIIFDGTIYICTVMLIFLLWCYHRTRDKDLIYFALADMFYILAEICYDTFDKSMGISIDSLFFILFYFFIFLFLRQRTKVLLKNPAATENTLVKTWILIVNDYMIIAAFSYLIFYCFDRISLSSQPVISSLNYSIIINFLYPALDFLLLGYYISLNKIYIVTDRKVYLPLVAGMSISTISDFLIAYEEMFSAETYKFGDYLQIIGLVFLIILLILIKSSKTDSYYTTINLYRDNSKLGNYSLLMNGFILLYIFIYIYCLIFANSLILMNTVKELGIVLLIFTILRLNIINYDLQYRLNKMSKDASTDPLTGLFSRKYAFTLMQSLFKSSLYFNINISVLMLDIDHFKKYNDTYGHVSGDYLLKDISKLINSSIGESNIICRYGGEEFLIILPGIDEAKGLIIAEKIRKNIEAYDFYEGKLQSLGKVTVSIGGATSGGKTRDEIELIEQADTALYKAKEERNKSSWFTIN